MSFNGTGLQRQIIMVSRENIWQNRSGVGARDAERIGNDPPWKNAGCGSPSPPSAVSLKQGLLSV